jgi:acyl carrier protein
MEKREVVQRIIDVLKSVQEISGRQISDINAGTCPIGDLDGFDSLSGVEASAELSEKLGFELPGTNAFVNEKGNKALSIDEMADAICSASKDPKK